MAICLAQAVLVKENTVDFETMLQQFLQQRQQPNGMTQSQQPWQQRQGGWPSQQQQPQDLSMFMQYLQPQQQPIAHTDSVDQLKANGVQPKQSGGSAGGLMSKG